MSEASLDPALREAALAWIAQDPDPETRAELDALLQQADAGEPGAIAELQDRFAGRLTFGTAGLRAALGAGPRRMNRVVGGQAALGLAAWLHQHVAAQPIRSTPSRLSESSSAIPRCRRDSPMSFGPGPIGNRALVATTICRAAVGCALSQRPTISSDTPFE